MKRMLLLIDDDDDFRLALAANLADDGHRVSAHANPAAVELPCRQPVAMLILDYQMGGEDGLAFTDRFHAVHPEVPVLLVTAYSTEHLEAAVSMRPFMRLLRKPIDYDAVAALLPAGA